MDVKKILAENADPAYCQFSKKMIPGTTEIIGVRIPVLRRLARDLARRPDYEEFLSSRGSCYEEVMLRGLVVGYARHASWADFISSVRHFVPQINNWAVCDSVCSTLTRSTENLDQMLELIDEYLATGDEYMVRFAVVMLLDYYLTDKYMDAALERLLVVDCSAYYVMMGVAWAISVAFVRQPSKLRPFLAARLLDDKTQRKAIQKIVESYRVSSADKDFVRSLRVP